MAYGRDELDLYAQTDFNVRYDELQNDITDPASGETTGGSGSGASSLTSLTNTDNFVAISTPSPEVRQINKGSSVGNLWDKNAAAAITDPPTLTAGGLPIGAAYSQAEVTALRDALITLSDKVRDELAKLRTAGIQAT